MKHFVVRSQSHGRGTRQLEVEFGWFFKRIQLVLPMDFMVSTPSLQTRHVNSRTRRRMGIFLHLDTQIITKVI